MSDENYNYNWGKMRTGNRDFFFSFGVCRKSNNIGMKKISSYCYLEISFLLWFTLKQAQVCSR